jgi:hypothetical protein
MLQKIHLAKFTRHRAYHEFWELKINLLNFNSIGKIWPLVHIHLHDLHVGISYGLLDNATRTQKISMQYFTWEYNEILFIFYRWESVWLR